MCVIGIKKEGCALPEGSVSAMVDDVLQRYDLFLEKEHLQSIYEEVSLERGESAFVRKIDRENLCFIEHMARLERQHRPPG